MKKLIRATALLATGLLFSGSSLAALLDINNIVGGWSNPVGGQNVVITNVAAQGTDTIRWGDGVAPDSGYDFTPGADINGVPLNTIFSLGTFVHHNEPIPAGSSITSVDYALSFSTNGVPSALSTTLQFAHNETPNGDDPCADGTANGAGVNINGCADIVTVTSAALNSLITVGSDTYFFNLLGFSTDGGATFSTQFLSAEQQSNTAQLYGIVGQRIPEPTTLLLMAFGLLGFTQVRRVKARV